MRFFNTEGPVNCIIDPKKLDHVLKCDADEQGT